MRSDTPSPRYEDKSPPQLSVWWYLAALGVMVPFFYALGYFLVGPMLTGRAHQSPPQVVSVGEPPGLQSALSRKNRTEGNLKERERPDLLGQGNRTPLPAAPQNTPPADSGNSTLPEVTIIEHPEKKPALISKPPLPVSRTSPSAQATSHPSTSPSATEQPAEKPKPSRVRDRNKTVRLKPAETTAREPAAEPTATEPKTRETSPAAIETSSARPSPVSQKLYRVQVGIYSEKEKAQEIAGKLTAGGYLSYVGPIRRGEATHYKVQAGAR